MTCANELRAIEHIKLCTTQRDLHMQREKSNMKIKLWNMVKNNQEEKNYISAH